MKEILDRIRVIKCMSETSEYDSDSTFDEILEHALKHDKYIIDDKHHDNCFIDIMDSNGTIVYPMFAIMDYKECYKKHLEQCIDKHKRLYTIDKILDK